ncbi:MAG: hypothetical protein JOY71_06470, partial [Acetobacteraceae bacterium]|nr:hypothetical protein [Acetobacteraceae bacterium]
VVVDTAPNADQTALRAARASELVLVPCRPSILDLDAIVATLELCTIAKASALTILNAAPIRSRVVVDAGEAIRKVGGTVCPAIIRERVAFRHSLVDGWVAQEYEPDGQAAAEIAALYDAVTRKDAIAQARNPAREIA